MSRYGFTIAPAACHFARKAYRVTLTRDGSPWTPHPLDEPQLYFPGNDGRSARAEAKRTAAAHVAKLELQWSSVVRAYLDRYSVRERAWKGGPSDYMLERDGSPVYRSNEPGGAAWTSRGAAEAARVLFAEADARNLETQDETGVVPGQAAKADPLAPGLGVLILDKESGQ